MPPKYTDPELNETWDVAPLAKHPQAAHPGRLPRRRSALRAAMDALALDDTMIVPFESEAQGSRLRYTASKVARERSLRARVTREYHPDGSMRRWFVYFDKPDA